MTIRCIKCCSKWTRTTHKKDDVTITCNHCGFVEELTKEEYDKQYIEED